MRRATSAAVSISTLVLMLAAASPALAGISDFAINRDATLAPGDLQVTVTGTVMCPVNEVPIISVLVTQIERAQLVTSGSGAIQFTCSGTVQSWQVLVTVNLPMHPGFASASANAMAFAGVFPL